MAANISAAKVNVKDDEVFGAAPWRNVPATRVAMEPTPLKQVVAISPYLVRLAHLGRKFGITKSIDVRALHNGSIIALSCSWQSPGSQRVQDLDQFVDGVAVMYALARNADPLKMGGQGKPVNIWLWKADLPEPFDVYAEGYGTSERRSAKSSGLLAKASYERGMWTVIFRRPLAAGKPGYIDFAPGRKIATAFAAWDGTNKERAGLKAFSGRKFLEMELSV